MPDLSPEQWRDRLVAAIDERWWSRLGVYDAYFEGDHRLAFATAKYREAFGSLLTASADNWCPMVVESRAERLKVQGFRLGRDQQSADDAAWGIWQANQLDAESALVHTEAIKLEEAYWLVQPPAAGSGDPPLITSEHPMQMIVASSPENRRVRLAALKKWTGDDGYLYATLYLPAVVVKWRSQKKVRDAGHGKVEWVARPDDQGGVNRLGVVPVVPVRNASSSLLRGRSALQSVIPLQDGINKLLGDMLVGSEFLAFPQRVAMGVEVPKDPTTGQPVTAAELQAAMSRVWFFENENAKIGEFTAAQLSNYTEARRDLIRSLTAQTRTPPHYVLAEIKNVSSDALQAAETGLVSIVRDVMSSVGESHEETIRLAFLAMGDRQRARDAVDAETIWRDPESRTEAERVDAAMKRKALGLPDEMVWEYLGMSPQEIDRALALRATEALLNPQPPVDPAAPGGLVGQAGAAAGMPAGMPGGAG